jgi:dTDP-4-dehydrorhamnose 3,5-epimerase
MSTIPGLWHEPITRYHEARGFFTEMFRESRYHEKLPADFQIKQINHSRSVAGVIRGIHGEPWHKLITPIRGRVRVGIVDLRPGATGVYNEELQEGEVLFVPKGCGNSFEALEETDYCYAVSAEWTAGVQYPAIGLRHAESLGIHFDGLAKLDELIASGLISEKDAAAGTIEEARAVMATLL